MKTARVPMLLILLASMILGSAARGMTGKDAMKTFSAGAVSQKTTDTIAAAARAADDDSKDAITIHDDTVYTRNDSIFISESSETKELKSGRTKEIIGLSVTAALGLLWLGVFIVISGLGHLN